MAPSYSSMSSRRPFRIFVSSPGDCGEEREICDKLIRQAAAEWAELADIQPLLWEQEPLAMDSSFQEQIPLPAESDVVIVTIWSRLGRRLHSRYKEAAD